MDGFQDIQLQGLHPWALSGVWVLWVQQTFFGSFSLAGCSACGIWQRRPLLVAARGPLTFAKFNFALSPQSLPGALSPSVAPDLRWLGCFISYAAGRTFWYNVTVLVKMDLNELIRVDSHLLNHSRLLHSVVWTKTTPPSLCPWFCYFLLLLCSARLIFFFVLFLIISVFLIPECQLHP